jgi:hypothetical protein
MLHACVERFDVMGGRENILDWDGKWTRPIIVETSTPIQKNYLHYCYRTNRKLRKSGSSGPGWILGGLTAESLRPGNGSGLPEFLVGTSVSQWFSVSSSFQCSTVHTLPSARANAILLHLRPSASRTWGRRNEQQKMGACPRLGTCAKG